MTSWRPTARSPSRSAASSSPTLVQCATIARELGARDVAFVATQPLRQAVDARAVVVAVEAASGVPLHVLDHAEEGLLNLLGAMAGRPVEAPLAVVDIGGGSSEVVVVEPGARARAGALALGGASLTRDARGPRSADGGARWPCCGRRPGPTSPAPRPALRP